MFVGAVAWACVLVMAMHDMCVCVDDFPLFSFE